MRQDDLTGDIVPGLTMLERVSALELLVRTHLAFSGADLQGLEAALRTMQLESDLEPASTTTEAVRRVYAQAMGVVRSTRRAIEIVDAAEAEAQPS